MDRNISATKKRNQTRGAGTIIKNMKMVVIIFSLFAVATASGQESGPRLATLAQQKMCAEQAKKAFDNSDAAKPSNDPKMKRISSNYTNHYDAKANVCYIMVHESYLHKKNEDDSISISYVVYDAFEGRGYASYMWFSEKGKKAWEVSPMECRVKPRGQDEITCKSSEEFDRLVEKHFGISTWD